MLVDNQRGNCDEFPFGVARRGYAVGSSVLEAVLPPDDGPTTAVPVTDDGLAEHDGIEAKTVILPSSQRLWRSSASTTRPGSRPWAAGPCTLAWR